MEYLLDESSLQKLVHLLADCPSLDLIEAPQALLDRLGVRQDIKGVLSDLPRDARHVRGAPRKDVSVGAEEVDEHHFLFAAERGADLQRLSIGGLRVEGNVLGALGRARRPRVPLLEVHGLLSHSLQLCGEGLVERQSLGVLDALDVALIGVLERGADGDDTFRARHLQLEVGVVGDGHELGVAWTPKDGVVRPPEPHHLEGEQLLAEVGYRAEANE